MSEVKLNDVVEVHYTGKLTDGEVFDSSVGKTPLQFTVGTGQVIKGFEDGVLGMKVGEFKTINIPCNEAYGEVREELFFKVGKEQFPPEINPQIGDRFQVPQENGMPITVKVTEIDETGVTLDANHELAGKDLIFDIELVKIG